MVDFILAWGSASWVLWLDLAPYLVLGFALAGLLHGFLGESLIRKHFASNHFSSILKATLLGIPLPVCSCGVIPLAESLRKDGASKGATMAFLVSTPTSGVDSILATYGLMGPFFAIMRPLAGLLAGLGIGALTRFVSQEEVDEPHRMTTPQAAKSKPFSIRGLRDIIDYGFGQLPRDTGKWVLLGTLAGGLITALVPAGFVQGYLGNPILQYLAVLLLSIPLYVCATGSIPLAMALMSSGVLPGAALVLLIAGPATNTVTLTFLFKRMGLKVTVLYLATISLVAILLGVLTDWFFSSGLSLAAPLHLHHQANEISPLTLIMALVMLALILWHVLQIKRWFDMLVRSRKTAGSPTLVTVPDMTCMVCERKIRTQLSTLPGLESVTIDLAKKTVSFADPQLQNTVIGELERLGYHPRPGC